MAGSRRQAQRSRCRPGDRRTDSHDGSFGNEDEGHSPSIFASDPTGKDRLRLTGFVPSPGWPAESA